MHSEQRSTAVVMPARMRKHHCCHPCARAQLQLTIKLLSGALNAAKLHGECSMQPLLVPAAKQVPPPPPLSPSPPPALPTCGARAWRAACASARLSGGGLSHIGRP